MSEPLRDPWKAIIGKSNYRFEVEDAKGFTVARVVGGLMDGGKRKADLIAAAPDLFRAVKDLLDDIAYADLGDQCECGRFENSPEPQSCAHTRARAALAKVAP